MTDNDKRRNPTSSALIELRKEMGMTQAQFAVLVLDTAITTISRYETTHPPQGDQILRFRDIAKEQAAREPKGSEKHRAFVKLADLFSNLYVEDAMKKMGEHALISPKTDTEREHAHLLTRVNGKGAVTLATTLVLLEPYLSVDDPKALSAVDILLNEVRKFAPQVYELTMTAVNMAALGLGPTHVIDAPATKTTQPPPAADKTPATATTKPKRKKKQ
jgi:hypothetical protein